MTRRKRSGRITPADPPEWEPEPLTKSQILRLKRSVRDLDDRRRFLIASAFHGRMVFYYDVSRDLWGMNDPTLGTVFKRRNAASAVQALLREGVRVVKCRVNRRNQVIRSSVTLANVRVPKTRRGRVGGRDLKNADLVGAAETLFQGLDEREC
jgi:hypothetical protein